MSEMIVTEKGRAQPEKLTVWDAGTRIAVDVGTGYPAAGVPEKSGGMEECSTLSEGTTH